MADRKEVKLSDGQVLFVTKPNVLQTQKADWEYSKVFNEAIRNGIPPRTVMLETLRKNDVWTQEDEQLERVLRAAVDQQVIKLADLKTKEKVEPATVEQAIRDIRVAREALQAHMTKLMGYLQHTAENKADDSRLYYLVALCTETKEGKPAWGSYDEFRKETNGEKLTACVTQFILFQAGIDNLDTLSEAASDSDDKAAE